MKNICSGVLLLLLLLSCYKQKDYSGSASTVAFTLTADTSFLPADNFSTATIAVSIPWDADDSLSGVVFTTTDGTFVSTNNKSVTAKAKRDYEQHKKTAEITLKSSNHTGTAHVSVEFFDVKKTIDINFIRALPDKIKIVPSSLSIRPSNSAAAGGEVSIEVNSFRSKGNASTDNTIDIKAWDTLYKRNLGNFRIQNTALDVNGKAAFTFVLGDSTLNKMTSAYTGPFYLVATLQGANPPVQDTAVIISSR